MTIKAFIFDFDGTLINSNQLHIESWRRSFERFGFPIEADRIGVEIGRDGQGLLTAILGESIDEETSRQLRDTAKQELATLIDEQKPLEVFPGIRELFGEIRKRGLKSALATSASESDLKLLIEGSGLDVYELCDVVTNADDAESGKPAPDILHAACEKLGVETPECIFVGDAIWDAKACKEAGIYAVGVLQGSVVDEARLREAGMKRVYSTTEELLEDLPRILENAASQQNSS